MIRYVLRRLLALAAVLLAASFLIFAAVYIAPGSPESFLLQGKTVSPATVHAIREQYHLNDPFLVQYQKWLEGVLRGDFGRSIVFRQSVAGLVWSRVSVTAALTLYAALLILIGGVGIGALAAVRRGAVADKGVLIGTSAAAAMPSFVAAIVLAIVFAVHLGWFPVFGSGSGVGGTVWHLTLPAFALALSWVGLVGRVTRSAMLDELRREYVETGRSRGFQERVVIRRHVLRNALIPISTISGIVVAGLISGAVVVESAFALNGLGSLLLQSVTTKDFPVIQAISLILVAVFVIANTVVDVLYVFIDPRVRIGGAR